jgi:hypothetical protein
VRDVLPALAVDQLGRWGVGQVTAGRKDVGGEEGPRASEVVAPEGDVIWIQLVVSAAGG